MKKEEQIRMLLHPEKYTDEQLDQMLDEVNIPVPEPNEEWARFKKKRSGSPILKIAASIIGVLMLSGISYATIAHFIETDEKPKTAIAELCNGSPTTPFRRLSTRSTTSRKCV